MRQQLPQPPTKLAHYNLNAPDAPILYFFHIPKTAGISMRVALTERFWPEQAFPGQAWGHLLSCTPDELAEYRLFFGHFYSNLYRVLPEQPLTITVIREPIARSLSHFRSIWLKPEHYYHEAARQLGSLVKFLEDPVGRALITNFQTRMLAVDHDPQTVALTRDLSEPYVLEAESELATIPDIADAELLARAKARLDSFAFVGLTDRLRESLWLLDYMFGWWPAAEVPRENVTPIDGVSGDISPDALAMLKALTALDAELYRYAAQRFNTDYAQMMTEIIQQQAIASQPALNQQRIELNFDYQLPGTGWYPPERDPDGQIFRWLGPVPQANVFLQLPTDRPIKISGYIAFGMVPELINSLKMTVEQTPVPLYLVPTTQYGYTFSGTIPAGAAATVGLTCLTFSVSHTVSPREIDPESTDNRPVGLAFCWLRLSYQGGLESILNRAFHQFTGTN